MSAATVRDAATVVLLRDGSYGLETWLLTRVRQMAFAAGASVFPGGSVDPADGDLPWDDDAVESFGPLLGGSGADARRLTGAAVRELFEETGVLLSEPAPGRDVLAARAEVEAGTQPLAGLLDAHGLALSVRGIRPWARWITPEGEGRRYDTRFFVAVLPQRAEAHDVTGEASVAGWIGVSSALGQFDRGERYLLPPTLSVLRDIGAFTRAADVLAGAPQEAITAITPVLHSEPDRRWVELPDGRTFDVPNPVTRD